MGLLDLIHEPRTEILSKEEEDAAREVIPEFFIKGEEAPEYRAYLLRAYADRDGVPPRRDGNGEYRSVEQTRLDRAWQDVADRMDRSEGDIRSCVLSVYEGPGEYADQPERLRSDFDEILARVDEDCGDSVTEINPESDP